MTCSSRYAEAWEYSSFYCIGSIIVGLHGGVGPGDATLEDADKDFISLGVRPLVGQVAYNLTDNTSGNITAVTTTTITATGVTWDNGDSYRISTIDATEIAIIEHYLDVAAADVTIALRSVGACDCTWWSEFDTWAKKINIIEAGVLHICPCASPSMSDAQMQLLLEWADAQLERVRTMEFDPCDGHYGKAFPATGWAEQTITPFSHADIIINSILRDG